MVNIVRRTPRGEYILIAGLLFENALLLAGALDSSGSATVRIACTAVLALFLRWFLS